jgi:transposase
VKVNGVSKHGPLTPLGTADDIAKKYSEIYSTELSSLVNSSKDIEFDCAQYQFSAVAALYDLTQRLDLVKIIDKYCPKREPGLSVGTYLILAAINRAIEPVSKNIFYDWFKTTILVPLYPEASKESLSSQSFWKHMTGLNQNLILKIEDEISTKIIDKYNISTEYILFDNTIFFSYINTINKSKITQRGHSKEKRSYLKIIGLSLMVSQGNNIPLFHKTYHGNRRDSKQFLEVITKLQERTSKISNNSGYITLIFDKDNNSDEIIALIEDLIIQKLHFVGSLRFNQCPELISLDRSEYSPLVGKQFEGTTVYRYQKMIFGKNITVLVTDNENLRESQLRGIEENIQKCESEFRYLLERLKKREDGQITKGKKPTVESVSKNIKTILTGDYMK